MVSFQTPFPQLDDQRKIVSETDNEGNSKNSKRKWNDSLVDEVIVPYKHWRNPKVNTNTNTNTNTIKSFSDIELHLETPLPSEWQRCLDIQSGEIHFYNTRTQKRTLRDPRENGSDPPSPRDCHMSLDLELNLPCGSLNHNSPKSTPQKNSPIMNKKSSNSPPPLQPVRASMDLFRNLSTVGNKNDGVVEEADESKEMVAIACKRCHMLVMLCKSSPTCPNCKYVHPPCQSALDLFKPRLSLSY